MAFVGILVEEVTILPIGELYDPDQTDEVNANKKVPKVGSIVVDGSVLYTVIAVDATTYKSTLSNARMLISSGDESGVTSVVSYKNDIFRLFYTDRVSPTKLTVDRNLTFGGSDVSSYRLSRLKSDNSGYEIISIHYNEQGQLTGEMVPMDLVESDRPNVRYCSECYTNAILSEDDSIRLQVFNEYGEEIAQVNLIAKPSVIVNTLDKYVPTITNMRIKSSQITEDNDIYIYEGQSVESLGLIIELTYDTGYTREVPIDDNKCIIYGLDDFVASFTGLRQSILVKYFLDVEEPAQDAISVGVTRFLSVEANLYVKPSEVSASIKLSPLPIWSNSSGRYVLRYFAYDVDQQWMEDVSAYVSIVSGTFNGTLYGEWQEFVVSIDKKNIHSAGIIDTEMHLQSINVNLQPTGMYERYLLKESGNTSQIYGADTSTSRRPIIGYDVDALKYFIPSNIFTDKSLVIDSFYLKATPPYDTTLRIEPTTPTHFTLRDADSGVAVLPSPINLDSYALGFNTSLSVPAGNYLNQTVVVEFLHQLDTSTYLILYGVPVDVHPGTYTG